MKLQACLLLVVCSPPLAAQGSVSFHRQIAPILRENCAGCHHRGKRKGKLDLSTFAALLAGGESGPALVPGDPVGSLLLRRVRGPDPEMPPKGGPLGDEQVGLIARWIELGAKDDTPRETPARTGAPAVYRVAPPNPALAYSPHGRLLAVAGYHEILVHDAGGDALGVRLVGKSPRIESLAFSADGKWLAAAGGSPGEFGEIQIWNVTQSSLHRSFEVTADTLYGVSLSPDARAVAFGCADKTVRMIRIEDGTQLLEFRNHADWVLGTCFATDGKRLVSASRDKAMKIIDLATGRFVDDINNPIEQVLCLARHPTENLVLYGGNLGTPRLYRVSDNQKRTAARRDANLVRAFERHGGAVRAVAFSPDGRLAATGGADALVRVHEVATGKRVATLRGHSGPVFDLAFHPAGGQLAACGYDGRVRIWDLASGELARSFVPVPIVGRAPDAGDDFFVQLSVEPASLRLLDGRDERTVLVKGRNRQGKRVDLTGRAVFEADSPGVAIRDGYVVAQAAGKSSVTVRAAGLAVRIPVDVESAAPGTVHFTKDVMPILSRAGCNAGSCHGAQAGQNGFALSLRGFDPESDHRSLVRDLSGRRFDRVYPERSLMLLKSTAQVPHEGGKLFGIGSRYYERILEWIREGTSYRNDATSRVARLEVLPAAVQLDLPRESQHVLVRAHYDDGSDRDVTREAILSSSDTEVARIEGTRVIGLRRGEAAVLVRYEGVYATAPLTVMGDRDGFAWTDTPEYNFIDQHVHAKLRKIKTLPSELCTDAEFVRRIHLDLTGKPPRPETARSFVRDSTPSKDKRDRLIDQLIGSPAFVEHWGNKWADLLQCSSRTLGQKGVWVFRRWISQCMAENTPYDRFVRELVTARGSTYLAPAANYIRALSDRGRAPDPGKMTEDVTQTFLGIRFSCNKCHNHPFERWTQDQYYEFAAHFARVRFKDTGRPGEIVVYESYRGGEMTHPRTSMQVAPRVPFDAAAETNGGGRREALADWLTSRENKFFARSYVNRVWSYFFGHGIIEPVDDIRAGNPPSNPALLDALEKSFVDSGFDCNELFRTICRSRTYQASFRPNPWNADDRNNFSHCVPHRLSAEQLVDAVAIAAGVSPKIEGLPRGSRPVEAPDGIVKGNDFLRLFGRPKRESACECARTSNVSLAHALNLVGGALVHDAVVDPEGRVAAVVAREKDDATVVRELYWAALARAPTAEELATFADLGEGDERLAAAQDLLWALLNSPAFLFNR